jgi:hypothetical protein
VPRLTQSRDRHRWRSANGALSKLSTWRPKYIPVAGFQVARPRWLWCRSARNTSSWHSRPPEADSDRTHAARSQIVRAKDASTPAARPASCVAAREVAISFRPMRQPGTPTTWMGRPASACPSRTSSSTRDAGRHLPSGTIAPGRKTRLVDKRVVRLTLNRPRSWEGEQAETLAATVLYAVDY